MAKVAFSKRLKIKFANKAEEAFVIFSLSEINDANHSLTKFVRIYVQKRYVTSNIQEYHVTCLYTI